MSVLPLGSLCTSPRTRLDKLPEAKSSTGVAAVVVVPAVFSLNSSTSEGAAMLLLNRSIVPSSSR